MGCCVSQPQHTNAEPPAGRDLSEIHRTSKNQPTRGGFARVSFFTAFTRKLVRGSGWEKSDFFLGVELALAAITLALVNFIDLSKDTQKKSTSLDPNTIQSNALFMLIGMGLLLFVLTMHQDWEKKTKSPKGQVFWLGIVCNLFGAFLMISFIILVKGVE